MPLVELADVAQEPGEATRRWFRGDDIELVVWQDDAGVRLYQLRYPADDGDLVVEWRRGRGLRHYALDDGESRSARFKAAPVLRPTESGDIEAARSVFEREARDLDPGIRAVVERTLVPREAW